MEYIIKQLSWENYSLEVKNKEWQDFKNNFISCKVDFFSEKKNITKENVCRLFYEVSEIIDFDLKNTENRFIDNFYMDCSKSNINRYLFFYDYTTLVGRVFLNLFEKHQEYLPHAQEGKNSIIPTYEMYNQAIREISCYNKVEKKAYGATLVLSSLIERQTLDILKRKKCEEYLISLKLKIEKENIELSQNDSNLLSILYGEFVEKKESNLNEKYDNYFITTKELFRLLKEYKIIENNKFNQYIIENSCFISYNKMLEEHFNGVLDASVSDKLNSPLRDRIK